MPINYLQPINSLKNLPGSAFTPSNVGLGDDNPDPSTQLLALQDQRKSELLRNQAMNGLSGVMSGGQPKLTSGFMSGGNAADLQDVSKDIESNPITTQGADVQDFLGKLRNSNLLGFRSPQEQAAYPRIQAEKAAASESALKSAQGQVAIGRGAQAQGLAGEAGKRGEAEVIRANAAMEAARAANTKANMGPNPTGLAATQKDLTSKINARAALENSSGGVDAAQEGLAKTGFGRMMGMKSIEERKAILDQQIAELQKQIRPGSVNAQAQIPGGSVSPQNSSTPPPETQNLQPGQVFDAPDGFWPGAAISGAGEGLAELVEGSPISPTKITTESAFGAIPFGKVVKGGQLIASGIRSGALGAAHEAVSEGLGNQEMSGTNIATAGGLGAVLGAGGSRFMKANPTSKVGGGGEFIVEPTAQEGGRVLPSSGKVTAKNPLQDVLAPPPIKSSGDIILPGPSTGASTPNVPFNSPTPPAYRPSQKAAIAAEVKAARDAAAARQIENARMGREAGTPTTSDTFSAPNAQGGTSSVSIPYRTPKDSVEAAQLGVSGPKVPINPGSSVDLKELLTPQVEPTGVRNIPENVTPISNDLPLGERLAPQTPIPPVTPESIAAAKAARDAELAEYGASRNNEISNANADEARAKFSVVPPTESAPTIDQPPSAQSPLARFFKSRADTIGTTGKNYGDIKLDPTADPTAVQAARDTHLINLGRNPEGPLSRPEVPSTSPESVPSSSVSNPPGQDWVKEQSDLVDRLNSEKGGISPGLLKVMSPIAGAAIGAPIGAVNSPDDPGGGTLKGALAGGMIGGVAGGAMGGGGLKGLTDFRNAMLLSGPAQLKKPLSDLGGYIGLAAENAWNNPQLAKNLGREALNIPLNVSNYAKGFMNPEIARDVIGDQALKNVPQSTGLLRQVTRPFAGAQYATQQAMERAGVKPEAGKDALMLGEPKTPLGQWFLKSQSLPGVGGQAMRFLTPFKRIATNIAERGFERTPGPSLFMGPKDTRTARTITGAGAMAGGALTGASDQNQAEEGNPTSPMVKGLRRASLASYGLPFAIGESLGGSNALEVYNLIPGLRELVPPPGQGESVIDWLKKQGSHTLDQILPSILNLNQPGQGSAR